MEIYLVRHTTPAVAKGVCYGQADLDITPSFHAEAAIIQQFLPGDIAAVYSSPLQRCNKLAEHLFDAGLIQLHDDLMEINCGEWEMKFWNELPHEEVQPWMDDNIHVRIPGGENYLDLFNRVVAWFNHITQQHILSAGMAKLAIVAHGGVIRSILSHITGTTLSDSFTTFSFHYGCVVRLRAGNNGWQYDILSNIPQEKETHKPSKS